MANLPQPGDTNWGTTLNSFLLTAHNSDGSIRGSGSITAIEVVSETAYQSSSKNTNTLYIIT